jgi:predicted nucleic acid-binding protein
MPDSFFDTNVLMYLATDDRRKADHVEQLLRFRGTISVQVLNEITNVSRRKFGFSWRETFTILSTVRSYLDVVPVTLAIHHSGLRLAERYGFAIYDSFIVAAALAAGCDTLWSEDMQDGMVVDDRLRIANPFGDQAAP